MREDLDRLSESMQRYWENLAEEANEEIFPEVRSVLEALREKGIELGVLSSRTVTTSKKSLEKHSIRDYFRYVISPQTARAPKSKKSPEMWQFALRQIGARAEEVLHVDDDYETGIVGATEAGIRAVLIDRSGKSTSTFDCIVIGNLAEVLELV